jgi:hypothetical protein
LAWWGFERGSSLRKMAQGWVTRFFVACPVLVLSFYVPTCPVPALAFYVPPRPQRARTDGAAENLG